MRPIICTRYLTKVAGDVIAHGRQKLSVVEGVEKLGAELERNSLGNRCDLVQRVLKLLMPGPLKKLLLELPGTSNIICENADVSKYCPALLQDLAS